MKVRTWWGMRSLIAVLRSIMNVEKAAYTSNHDEAERKLVKGEEKLPKEVLMVELNVLWFMLIHSGSYIEPPYIKGESDTLVFLLIKSFRVSLSRDTQVLYLKESLRIFYFFILRITKNFLFIYSKTHLIKHSPVYSYFLVSQENLKETFHIIKL